MKFRFVLVLGALVAVVALVPAVAVGGTPPTSELRMWMLPPADYLGNQACFTNRWHSLESDPHRALDWKATCGSKVTEAVWFRAIGADIGAPGYPTIWDPMYGVAQDFATTSCDGGTVHTGRVKLYDLLGHLQGWMVFSHADMVSGPTSVFDIHFKKGATKTTAAMNNWNVGGTTMDGLLDPYGGSTDCWSNWHIHENNNEDTGFWDETGFNSKWTTATLNASYTNNAPGNHTRSFVFYFTSGE